MAVHTDGRELGSFDSIHVDAFARRWSRRLGGAALIAVSAVGWLALVSWSASDPSLNGGAATDATNFMGPIGALFADLVFQSLGLTAVMLLIAVAAWGYELCTRLYVRRFSFRLGMWALAGFFLAGALSGLPRLEAWPLHHSYGGLVGSVVFDSFAGMVATIEPNFGPIAAGLALAWFGALCYARAVGYQLREFRQAFEAPEPRGGGKNNRLAQIGSVAAGAGALFRRPFRSKQNRRARDAARDVEFPPSLDPEDYDDPDLSEPEHDDASSIDPRGFGVLDDDDSRRIAERFAPAHAVKKKRRNSAEAKPEVRAQAVTGLTTGAGEEESRYNLPTLRLLDKGKSVQTPPQVNEASLRGTSRLLEDVLRDYGVRGQITNVHPGPVITLYELEPKRGVKASRVIGLADDIARSMSAVSARIAAIPGSNTLGIELPNVRREPVLLRDILKSNAYSRTQATLPLALGRCIDGEPMVADLAAMPHLLVAGTTGSGKSVGLNAMILSLLFRHQPETLRLILIDPKLLELSVYNGIPHLLSPVITDPSHAVTALRWAVGEMDERYKLMAGLGVRNIQVFNKRVRNARRLGQSLRKKIQTGFDHKTGSAKFEEKNLSAEPMPNIVIVIDEMADLMLTAGKDCEHAIQRLSQMARAAGIHLVAATQRPSVDVVTGVIKSNLPTRISFKVASAADSRTILAQQGAEHLLGAGDMLYATGSGEHTRVHGAFVTDDEIERVARFLGDQGPPPDMPDILAMEPPSSADGSSRRKGRDDLYDKAVALVTREGRASASYLQRRLAIGFNRAADMIERMEHAGLVSLPDSSGRREVLDERAGQ